MKDDLLDRLEIWRVSCGRPDLCGEAMAEIKRLRAELVEKDKSYVREMAKVALRDAELERLRALANSHAAMENRLVVERDELLAVCKMMKGNIRQGYTTTYAQAQTIEAAITKAEGRKK